MLKRLIPLGIICCLMYVSSMSSQSNWSLKKSSEGIEIFTRSKPNSNYQEYKATTSLETSIDNVLDQLLDAPAFYEGCPSGISYYLRMEGEDQHVFYAKKKLPWPIKDRDIVTLLSVEKISDTKIKLTLEGLPDGISVMKNTIRIKELMGHWLLEEMDGVTQVTQQLFIDPEGSLPSLITNALLIKGPYKTFSNLRSSLEN